MTLEKLKKFTGMESWLDLYNWLYETGYAGKESVTLVAPIGPADYFSNVNEAQANAQPCSECTLKIADVKAWAFDEIYQRMPLKASVSVIVEIVEEVARFSSVSSNPIYTFLYNLPTRAK